MNNIEKLAIEQQPQIKPLWLVIDEQGYPIHCASYKEACNEHINDAINDFDLTDAKYWKVVEAVPKALQSSEPVAVYPKGYVAVPPAIPENIYRELGAEHGYPNEQRSKTYRLILAAFQKHGLIYTIPPSTVSIEEHNKRIAELEADIDTYVPIANQQATEIMQLQATNKKLLDALNEAEVKIKALPRFNFLLNAAGNGVAKWENKSGDWVERYEVMNILEQAIAEAEGVKG